MNRTHGMKGTPTYYSWQAMKKRCSLPADPAFPRYGGRGLFVCEKWLTFEGFFEDMGERPEGMTLDRKDNDEGYHLANVRWATAAVQNNNRRGGPGRVFKHGNRWVVRFQGQTMIPAIYKSFETKVEADQFRIEYTNLYMEDV